MMVATRPDVVRRSLKVGAIVGTVLVAINQGSVLLAGQLTSPVIIKIMMTYCVPYCVSTYASVTSILDQNDRM